MKKLFTLSLVMVFFLSLATQLDAQTPRMAFYEEVTQASCPPCAGLNPPFQALVNANSETTLFMGYQVWWPGFDPMYLDNEEEVQDRVGYYGVNSAPTVIIQGTPTAQTYNQGQIDGVTAEMSEFALTLNAEVVDGVLNVTGSVEATMVASGNLRLRLALTEDLITIEDAPGGTNGETEYHHVFKRFIGGSAGIELAADWAVGDTYEIDMSMPLGGTNIYHFDGLEVIGWIQNDATQFIHQAAKVSEVELISTTANNGIAVETSGFEATYCTGEQTITPVFKLQNGGSDNLTSAVITYNVNGGADQMVNWTGDIATLGTADVTLDPITFDQPADGSTLNITVSMPNGVADEATDNDAVAAVIGVAPAYDGTVQLVLTTDDYGNETYWQMAGSDGTVIASGGNAGVGLNNTGVGAGAPPADAGAYGNNATITEEIALPADDCYTFTITDYWGDGICCGFGEGSFFLNDAQGNSLISGGEFTAQNDTPFEGSMLVNAEDIAFTAQFTVSPNPVVDIAKVAFTVETAATTTISVVNSLGQVVSRENLGKLSTGVHNLDVDMTGLPAGIYMLNINSGNTTGTKSVVVGSRF